MDNNKPNVIINPITFPNVLVSDAEKASQEFGLRIGQSIQYEWFRRSGNSCRFYDQWVDFHRLRLYARGEQSIAKYKATFDPQGDLSHLNLDWTPVPIIPKFVDIVVNGMQERVFKIKAEAVDIMSAEKKNAFQKMVEVNMIAKEPLEALSEAYGMDMFDIPKDDIPENESELNLYMQMNYKPSIEIAEEVAIDTLLEQNRYDVVKRQVDYDLTVLGVGMARHMFLPNSGVRVEYVDPANVVYSYTESPTFDDVFYWGEVKQVAISELYKIKPNITKDELNEISNLGSAWYDYYGVMRTYRNDLFQRDVVTLLYFNYKTDKKFVYKKKKLDNGMEKVIQKDESFNPEPNDKFERVEKRIDVWYEGIMVMGSSYLLKWDLSKNMVRPQSASQYALPNYVACAPRMYKGGIESLVRRMITFADLIQMTHLKLQQVLSKMVPDGVYLDADGINEVDLGTGAAYTPEDALKLYFQTGSIVGRSFTQDGEFNHGRIPIQELNSNSGQAKISSLVSTYNHYLNMIRDVTGLNEARDASTPDANSLVGIQKLAAANSNTATRHIMQASLFITKRMAEALSCRIADVLEYSDFREEFAMQVGKYTIGILEDVKDLYLHDFGIFIEVSPDEEEKAKLEENIQMALRGDQITLEDAIDIREMKNTKMANELLKKKRKDRDKKRMQEEQQKMQMQTQSNVQSSQAAAQSKMQAIQAEGQIKMQIAQSQMSMEMEKMKQEAALKLELMQREFEMQMQLKQTEMSILTQRDKQKEDAKDNRTKIQATQQSKMIEQRKKDLPSMDFESNEDSLDGFALNEFEPR
jgi:hypothetical protein